VYTGLFMSLFMSPIPLLHVMVSGRFATTRGATRRSVVLRWTVRRDQALATGGDDWWRLSFTCGSVPTWVWCVTWDVVPSSLGVVENSMPTSVPRGSPAVPTVGLLSPWIHYRTTTFPARATLLPVTTVGKTYRAGKR